jgi:beta-mannosidase
VTSWSAVDYFGRWKALQYQVKRSFENLLISITEDINNYQIYVINDDLKSYDGDFNIRLLDFNGHKLWEINENFETLENSSELHFEIPKENVAIKDRLKSLFSITYKTTEGKNVEALYYFVKPKELILTKPTIKITKIDDLTIAISSDVLAKNVCLAAKEEPFFSNNYFDILPNQKVVITLSKPAVEIKVKSLFDTLK